ncbi:MAG: transcription termination/antitermination protein NusA [Candidatus Coatesbacteria bacterium]|nr:MAG: transcription termination/antitermination protein NusA [Candidatus Coatesbacteria bacterium]
MRLDTSFQTMIDQLAKSKNIDRKVLIEAIESALSSASRRSHLDVEEMDIRLRELEDGIEVVRVKTVVEEVENPSIEIGLEEARAIDSDAEIGDEIEYDVDPATFGRNAAQIAKQVIIQRLREAEREVVYNEYKDREGDLISGVVQGDTRGMLVVNIGKTEAYLPIREQMPNEVYRHGQRIRALVLKVKMTGRGPQIILSRSHPDMVKALFMEQIPEVKDGYVEIVSIAREPGERTKVAVKSSDVNIDPVGTCVGMRGYRVQSIVRELSGEKIDIIEWSDDIAQMVVDALSPARVDRVRVDSDEREVEIIVPDDQLSVAIGKNGHNVRLASKLLDWKIDIRSRSDEEMAEVFEEKLYENFIEHITMIPGVGESIADSLFDSGYKTIHEVSEASPEDLVGVKGVGVKLAEKIVKEAGEIAKRVSREELQSMVREALEREKRTEGKMDEMVGLHKALEREEKTEQEKEDATDEEEQEMTSEGYEDGNMKRSKGEGSEGEIESKEEYEHEESD